MSDFKSYSQGDDFRRIDWNIYSRFDELFVRLSEVTTEQTIHFLLDSSESMDWRGQDTVPTKCTFARRLVGALGYAALWKFDRVVVTPFGDDVAESFGPVQGRTRVNSLLRYLSSIDTTPGTNVSMAMRRYVSGKRSPGLLFIISDLLSCEPQEFQDDLHHLRVRGWDIVVVHIIDDYELAPGHAMPLRDDLQPLTVSLFEAETSETLVLTPTDEVVERYQSAVEEWLSGIEQACDGEHATYFPLHTSWSFESLVLTVLYEGGVVA